MPDFIVRALTSAEDLEACVALQEEVWGRGFSERVPAALLRVSLRVGAVLGGAFDSSGRLLGHIYGLTGVRDGRVIHWSDMMAVHPAARDRGIGEALKRYQRETLLARNVTLAEWTFDPLESRNAWLNFSRFGAIAREYIRDFYATSDSPMHSGMATDRLIVTWDLTSARVERRLNGAESAATLETLQDAIPLNLARVENGIAIPAEPRLDIDAPRVLLAIPSDIQKIRNDALPIALQWRNVTRALFENYLGRGYSVVEFVRATGYGMYVLVNEATARAQ